MQRNAKARGARRAGVRVIAKLGAAACAVAVAALVLSEGCATAAIRPNGRDYQAPRVVRMTTTGYCNCRMCCGWRYNWYGKPVLSGGKGDGRAKKVGVTASGVRARPGTIAADTAKYPFGTIIEVPGYGYGRVEDRGGAVKGQHIDLWFPRHRDAREWGRKDLAVRVWLPKK